LTYYPLIKWGNTTSEVGCADQGINAGFTIPLSVLQTAEVENDCLKADNAQLLPCFLINYINV